MDCYSIPPFISLEWTFLFMAWWIWEEVCFPGIAVEDLTALKAGNDE
jgi:hypothetical protein